MKAARVLIILVLLLVMLAAVLPASADGTATVYVTSQGFEGGRMYWRADTGTIWVFIYTGQAYTFPVSSYSYLPDNPYFNQPPGYVRAINGFGKIWGSRPDVRNQLGWATTSEIGFYTQVVTQSGITYLNELDLKIIQINTNGTWQYVSSIPQPPPSVPQILWIDAAPNPVTAGSTLTVSWTVTGCELAIIEFYDSSNPSAPFVLLQDLPLSGTASVTVPATIGGNVQITIWAANRWYYYSPVPMYERVVQQTIVVGVLPLTGQTDYTQAAYQKYERGFMIWRADVGRVIVFWGDQGGPITTYEQNEYGVLPDNPITYVPPDRVRSINGFGKVWGNYQSVRDGIGYALGPEEAYTLTVVRSASTQSFRLPDGRWVTVSGAFWTF
jgi:hypothetical protein